MELTDPLYPTLIRYNQLPARVDSECIATPVRDKLGGLIDPVADARVHA